VYNPLALLILWNVRLKNKVEMDLSMVAQGELGTHPPRQTMSLPFYHERTLSL